MLRLARATQQHARRVVAAATLPLHPLRLRAFATASSSTPPPPPSQPKRRSVRSVREEEDAFDDDEEFDEDDRPLAEGEEEEAFELPPPEPFNPPANNPAGFLAELRSFATRFPQHEADELVQELPLAFSGDAGAVLSGQRRVVSADSQFSFACTGCGSCCRSYPNDVMLDVHDVWLLSRSPTGGEGGPMRSTTAMHLQYPRAFNRQLGLFESAPHVNIDTARKMAPVLFLRSKRVKQVAARSKTERIEERCWFAKQSDKDGSIELDEDEAPFAEEDGNDTRPPVVKPPSRNAGKLNGLGEPGLRCSLGKDNMPTSCALYPLGELYNGPAGDAAATAAPAAATDASGASGEPKAAESSAATTQYYTLDVTNCEGTRALTGPGGADPTTTVAAYAERNGLPARRVEWEWFERTLARPLASQGWMSFEPLPSERAALTFEFRHMLTAIVSDLWYDFDSLDLTPSVSEVEALSAAAVAVGVQPKVSVKRAFPDWPSARAAILQGTEVIARATEEYMRACGPAPSLEVQLTAERQWMETVRGAGLFKRKALRPREPLIAPKKSEAVKHDKAQTDRSDKSFRRYNTKQA